MILALNVAATDKNSRHPNIQTSVLFIFYAKTLIKVVFEHFADRPQPLYDSFTGKLAPSTLLLVNVLTEKDVDHVLSKKLRKNAIDTLRSEYLKLERHQPVFYHFLEMIHFL